MILVRCFGDDTIDHVEEELGKPSDRAASR
jgi:hypothetical protein